MFNKYYLDFSEENIKICLLKTKTNEIIKSINYERKKDLKEDVTTLKETLKNSELKINKANIILSHKEIITRVVEINKINEKDLKNLIKNNINDYFTFNTEEYIFDYRIIDTITREGKEFFMILLFAIPEKYLEEIYHICKENKISILEINLYANLIYETFKQPDKISCVIHLQKNKVDFLSMNKETFFMYANFDFDENPNDYISNIEGYLNFFSTKHYGQRIEEVFLVGDENDNIYIEVKDALNNLNYSINENNSYNKLNEYTSIIMMAKSIKDKNIKLKFDSLLKQKESKKIRNYAVASVMISLLLVFFMTEIYHPFSIKSRNDHHLQTLKTQINDSEEVFSLYENYQNKKNEVSSKESLINSVLEDKIDVALLLKELNNIIPNYVIINNLSINSEGSVNINVDILNTLEIADFISQLEGTELFKDVTIGVVNINDEKQQINFSLDLRDEVKENFNIPTEGITN